MTHLRDELPAPWRPFLDAAAYRALENIDTYLSSHPRYLPERAKLFRALELCSPQAVKVIILGQDPYHSHGKADGLAFSVRPGFYKNSSSCGRTLKAVFGELTRDLNVPRPVGCELAYLANQGVLLLNRWLTVEAGVPGSHRGIGWDDVIESLLTNLISSREKLVFILWGEPSIELGTRLRRKGNCFIKSAHPNARNNAKNPFPGSRPFSRANAALEAYGLEPVDWSPTRLQTRLS